MLKSRMRRVFVIMSISSMILMSACKSINRDIADEVCVALNEKYNEEFKPLKIGNRLNTGSATLYLCPSSNEKLLFTAKIDNKTRQVTDDYLLQKIYSEVERMVNESFSGQALTATSCCNVFMHNFSEAEIRECTPGEFQKEQGFDFYAIFLLLHNKDIDAQKLQEAMVNSNNKVDTKLRFKICVFEEDNYKECISILDYTPVINSTQISERNPIKTFLVDVEDGKCSLNIEELERIIEGL